VIRSQPKMRPILEKEKFGERPMTITTKSRSPFTTLFAGAALSAAIVAAAPAHAGPLDFIKKAVKKELVEITQSATQGVVDATFKGEKDTKAQSSEGGFRQEGGTTVETADDVQAPQEEGAAMLLPAVQPVREAARPRHSRMSQNGTTVETANTVQAPQKPQRAKLKQNGTTIATAGEVQAPTTTPAALAGDEHSAGDEHEITYDIAAGVDRTPHNVTPQGSQASTEQKLPKFRREKGTTVATADDVAAPSR
jgi:hypothetical protein